MSKGVVFKQQYKSANLPSTPALNVKYLDYIATRKGAIHNPGCGFGLWGRLPGMTEAQDINDFKFAKHTVSVASKRHTLYRAILSVDKETAARHGLYYRSIWQDLVSRKADVLAKEMNICRRDFSWVASMHYTKGHPHVHIMYWDNSARVRKEFIPPERFEIMAERVRSAFGREVYQEELSALQEDHTELEKQARQELSAMCREANLIEALNLDHVPAVKLDELGKQFAELALAVPDKGRLVYGLLPNGYKEKLNAFIDEVMEISDFSRLQTRYIKLTDQISALYGNGDRTMAFNREEALKKLYTGLGNSVLSVVKEYMAELRAEAPEEVTELRVLVEPAVRRILQTTPDYQKLLGLLPKERTPLKVLLESEQFQETKEAVVKELCRDLRVRTLLRRYVEARRQEPRSETVAKRNAVQATEKAEGGHPPQKAEVSSGLQDEKEGKANGAGEEKKGSKADIYKELYRSVDHVVLARLREDAGYDRQRDSGAALMLLLRMFHSGSQGANQMQSQRDLLRQRPQRELSETARLERRKQMEQGGGWSM